MLELGDVVSEIIEGYFDETVSVSSPSSLSMDKNIFGAGYGRKTHKQYSDVTTTKPMLFATTWHNTDDNR